MALSDKNVREVNIPIRPFLYSLDQIGAMIDMDAEMLAKGFIYFDGRSIGIKRNWQMMARNIAPPDMTPEWRVLDREFIRWMRNQGFRVVERGWVRD